jgi:hypothetical protein
MSSPINQNPVSLISVQLNLQKFKEIRLRNSKYESVNWNAVLKSINKFKQKYIIIIIIIIIVVVVFSAIRI